jgi:GMP synthase-like glutamine amidotransferase
MKIIVLQHVPFEGPAAIQDWADRNNHTLERICCPDNANYPAIDSFDCLIIMGGPMSVNDQLPWMTAELAFIRECIDAEQYIIGICLGAQLIAQAIGGSILKNSVREIGWLPVQAVKHPSASSSAHAHDHHWVSNILPEQFTPLHWHGDTFTLPATASVILSSEGCAHQAFILGQHVLGLQFHLEFDTATASRVATECADELADGGPYVQSAETILHQPDNFKQANALLFKLLDALQQHYLQRA